MDAVRSESAAAAAGRSGSRPNGELACCCTCFVGLAFAMMLVLAYGVALPVRATVTDAELASLARERGEGVFEVELRIAGEVRYRPVHAGRSRLEATCPLKLLMPDAPRRAHMVVLHKGAISCY